MNILHILLFSFIVIVTVLHMVLIGVEIWHYKKMGYLIPIDNEKFRPKWIEKLVLFVCEGL